MRENLALPLRIYLKSVDNYMVITHAGQICKIIVRTVYVVKPSMPFLYVYELAIGIVAIKRNGASYKFVLMVLKALAIEKRKL